MRLKFGSAFIFAAVLGSCEQANDTLGLSYDECMLKNLKHADRIATVTVREACQRYHERPSTKKLDARGTMKRERDKTASFDFRIRNPHPNMIVTAFTVSVSFYAGMATKDRYLTTYHWSYREHVPPLDEITIGGMLEARDLGLVDVRAGGFPDESGAFGRTVPVFSLDAKMELGMQVLNK